MAIDSKLSAVLDEFDLGLARMQRAILNLRSHFDDGRQKNVSDMTDEEFAAHKKRMDAKK